jgi:hypothetical protein
MARSAREKDGGKAAELTSSVLITHHFHAQYTNQ